jgi:hypothetical protein
MRSKRSLKLQQLVLHNLSFPVNRLALKIVVEVVGVVSSGQPQSFAGFQNFAQTGGFSPTDLANIRARAVSPVRAVYQNAQQNVNRQRALQGGYSPGFGVLQDRMARGQSQGISDQSIAAEGEIGQMVQQGKLAGLQGMAGTEGTTSGGGSLRRRSMAW